MKRHKVKKVRFPEYKSKALIAEEELEEFYEQDKGLSDEDKYFDENPDATYESFNDEY